jgi:RNA ligase (TIGR02306 family)
MPNSTSVCEVIQIDNIQEHPNADSLDIIMVDGYTVCVRKGDFAVGDIACFIPPDNIVDTRRPEFKFLANGKSDTHRITIKKLRGIISYGLLLKVPSNVFCFVGDDLAEHFGITHYEPELAFTMKDDNVSGPSISKYDVDSALKFGRFIENNTLIFVTEKLNGCNARYIYKDGVQYCGSRQFWKKENDKDLWWQVFNRSPFIKSFCEANPDTILYGEIYGQVGGWKYGKINGTFAAFDIMKNGKFLDFDDFFGIIHKWDIPMVPLIKMAIPYNLDELKELSTGNSLIEGANHLREGVVFGTMIEGRHQKAGRLKFKVINPDYYEKVKK